MNRWLVVLYLLLLLPTSAKGGVPTFLNQNEDGSYEFLHLKTPPTDFKPKNPVALVDDVLVTDMPDDRVEVWIEGSISFLDPSDTREDLPFNLYTRGGEYLRSAVLPGRQIYLEVLLMSRDSVVLVSGWQRVAVARNFDSPESPEFKSRFQLVYILDKGLAEQGMPLTAKVKILAARRI